MEIHIITLFPESIHPYLNQSIMKKAQEKGLFHYILYNLADWSVKNTRRVDDRPYGWGAWTIITIEPLTNCIRDILWKTGEVPIFLMSPKWRLLTQEFAEQTSKLQKFIIICGHYEGIDARIFQVFPDIVEISIWEYVLSSWEVASLVFIDSIVRLIDWVISEDSRNEDSFSEMLQRKKEYPHYSRPKVFEGFSVPEVLLCGDHREIQKWKKNSLS